MGEYKKKKIAISLVDTKYTVISDVAESLSWRKSKNELNKQ